MGLRDSEAKIARSYRDLMRMWFYDVKPQWQDKNAEEMEKMLMEMDPVVRDTIKAMEEMASLLDAIKKECSDEE